MMIEFVVGRAGTGKTQECLAAMKDRMAADPVGNALVLLLPEHATYGAERRLAAMMEGKGEGFVRSLVFGFKRFARHVLQETGGAARPRITGLGRRLLLKRILGEEREQLQAFQRAAGQRGFTESLEGALEEFRIYGVDGAALGRVQDSLQDEYLCSKLSDLALLYTRYREKMAGRYNDTGDMMETLAAKIPESTLLEGAEVWVDGFDFFTPQELKILAALFQKAENVHITLTFDTAEGSRQEGSLFYRQAETLERLRQLAESLGLLVKMRTLEAARRFQNPALLSIERHVFHFPLKAQKGGEGVQIVEAATRRLEAEAAAADILRLAREQGMRWRDIAVLVREEDAYGDMFALTLEDYGIPFFRDSKRPGVHHPLAELVRSSFEAVRGWRYDAMFRALKTGFFSPVRDAIDLLENYVLEFGVRGQKKWTMEEDWSWRRRRSLDELQEETTDAERRRLDGINQCRRDVAEPLQKFAAELREAADVRGYALALYHFLLLLDAPGKLEKWADTAEAAGSLAEAREHRRIFDAIIGLLEQMVETSGEDKIQVKEFEDILCEGLDALQLSLIPPGLDYVTVADFDRNSVENARAVYILGANESVMPRHSSEKGLLSDADRLHLGEAGIELPRGSAESSFGEKFLLYKGFTEAREYLWVSYALADTEGKALSSSPIIGQIRAVLPEVKFRSIPLEVLGQERRLLLANGRQAVSGLAAALRVYREKKKLEPFWYDVYNWALQEESLQFVLQKVLQGIFFTAREETLPPELAQKLYTKNNRLRGSVTRFESFRACPFRHFACYGLRLGERIERNFGAPDLGTLLHGVLQDFGEQLREEGRHWRDVKEEECQKLVEEILARLAPKVQNEILLSSAQYKNYLQRIEKTARNSLLHLIEFDAANDFRPVALERSFGSGSGGMPPLAYPLGNGFVLEITGQIDRIDRDGENRYFLIIDYKTGEAHLDLLEVYYGLKLQLLTYLLVARDLLLRAADGEALPAAMLYCFLNNPLVNVKPHSGEEKEALNKARLMPGWLLEDEDVVRAINGTGRFTKVSLTKAGRLSRQQKGSLRTAEEFDVLLDYIAFMLKDTGKSILAGTVKASPYRIGGREACQYCLYRAFCGFDVRAGFSYSVLKKLETAEILDHMEIRGKEAVSWQKDEFGQNGKKKP